MGQRVRRAALCAFKSINSLRTIRLDYELRHQHIRRGRTDRYTDRLREAQNEGDPEQCIESHLERKILLPSDVQGSRLPAFRCYRGELSSRDRATRYTAQVSTARLSTRTIAILQEQAASPFYALYLFPLGGGKLGL